MIEKKTRHLHQGFAAIKLLVVVAVLVIIGVLALSSYKTLSQKNQTQSLTTSLSDAAEKIEKYKSASDIKIYPSSLKKAAVTQEEGVDYTYVGSNTAFCLSGTVDEEVYYVSNTNRTPETGNCADKDVATDAGCFETKDVDGGVEITAYRGGGGSFYAVDSMTTCPSDIRIPFTIAGQQVVSIGDAAFSTLYNSWSQSGFSITAVSIPDSVTSIGMSAFASNTISVITLPSSVKTIDSYAFQGNGAAAVVLSDATTKIGQSAFQYNALGSVSIPASVTSIGQYAFSNNSTISCDFLGENKFKGSETGCYGEVPSY